MKLRIENFGSFEEEIDLHTALNLKMMIHDIPWLDGYWTKQDDINSLVRKTFFKYANQL